MSAELIAKIDELIEEIDERLIQDTINLVNINSEQSLPKPGAPFGDGPKKVLDAVLSIGENDGFFTTDYNVGVVSLAMKETQPDLGIWVHGDVVPAGSGWNFEPYNATFYKNCVIGRGAADNKGQLAALINLFRILKNIGIELNYNPAIYVGSNEETGMGDIKGIEGNPDAKGFMNICKYPRLSLVPDGSFPVGYGAMGTSGIKIKSKTPLHNCILTAGLRETPGNATAVFENTVLPDVMEGCTVEKGEKTVVSSYTPPRHGAHPDPNGNMITLITKALVGCEAVCDEDKNILGFIKDISLDVNGTLFGIDVTDGEMGRTTVFTKAIMDCDGCPELEIRVRYSSKLNIEKIMENIKKVCDEKGFEATFISGHEPYVNDKDCEVVRKLTEASNKVKGVDKAPYINGATYAHHVPNAYIFGMDANCPPEDFEKGRGGVHGVDEAVSIERLKKAMKIYARALLALNEIDW